MLWVFDQYVKYLSDCMHPPLPPPPLRPPPEADVFIFMMTSHLHGARSGRRRRRRRPPGMQPRTEPPPPPLVLLQGASSGKKEGKKQLTVSRSTQFQGNQPDTIQLGADAAGKYYALDYSWSNNDKIRIEFDFSLRFWKDAKSGKTSIYRGPILLAYVEPNRAVQAPALKASAMQ